MRLGNLVIAFFAVLALVIGSTAMSGLTYWLFTAAVIVAAGALTYVLFARRARDWVLESWRLLGEGRLAELEPRLDAELTKPRYGVAPVILEQLKGEWLLWSGDFEAALTQARSIDLERMPGIWHSAVHGLIVAAAIFSGRTAEAREALTRGEAALKEEPGFHHLQALVALREGDAAKARERMLSLSEPPPRHPLFRAALAMLQAEIALAHGEKVDALLADAIAQGGESFVPARARSLLTS